MAFWQGLTLIGTTRFIHTVVVGIRTGRGIESIGSYRLRSCYGNGRPPFTTIGRTYGVAKAVQIRQQISEGERE